MDPFITSLPQVYLVRGQSDCRCEARSTGFLEEWLPKVEALCLGFGVRPMGIRCPWAIFAKPLDRQHVALVQVSDQEHAGSSDSWGLRFYIVVIPLRIYRQSGADPFFLASEFTPQWGTKGELADLIWTCRTVPHRTVALVQQVLKRTDGPNLLGGAQLLVDGGRLVFQRSQPDLDSVRDLWTLLPYSTRGELWPASFAFGNDLGFDALVTPSAQGPAYEGYWTDQHTGDYPEGRYELNLQIAVEDEDQHSLDHVFARRSRTETWKLGLYVLLFGIGLAVLAAALTPRPAAPLPPAKKAH